MLEKERLLIPINWGFLTSITSESELAGSSSVSPIVYSYKISPQENIKHSQWRTCSISSCIRIFLAPGKW